MGEGGVNAPFGYATVINYYYYADNHKKKFMTESAKTGLIAHDRKVRQTQSLMNALSNIRPQTARVKGSAFFKHCGKPYEQSVALTEL